LARLGAAEMTGRDLVRALYPEILERDELPAATAGDRPSVGLKEGQSAEPAGCCRPVPGERIVGIRDGVRGDGLWGEAFGGEGANGARPRIVVHTIYCEKLAADDPPQSHWVDLQWREGDDVAAYSTVDVTVRNEIGVLSDIASVIARYGVSIANIGLQNKSENFVDLRIDVVVKDAKQLANMIAGIRVANHVVAAERVEGGERGDV
ncbi:MAG: ACT domain-containing protein, partial [Parvularculaceae bacterium]